MQARPKTRKDGATQTNADQDQARESSRYLTGSVQKALSLLKAFSFEKPEYNLVEMAHETGLHVSTVHRLLVTLESEGLVRRDPVNGRYRLAMKMFELGNVVLYGMELNIVGTPILARLATETEDTAYFTVLAEDAVVCVARVEGVRHSRAQFLAVGRHLPLHAGAGAKALLAYLPPARLSRILEHCPFPRYTENTIADPPGLMADLERVRSQGYALSDEEISVGIIAMAAPIRTDSGAVVAAISLSGAKERYAPGQARTAAIERVRDAANQISLRLGYLPRLASFNSHPADVIHS